MANKTRALLVGINDYSPIGNSSSDLRGCVNDVKDMANTLVICGYQPSLIKILTDKRATKANIIHHLKWLVKTAVSGDSILFYFSGHGSYRRDTNGDEIDGRDEVICPHDWPEYISDDDLSSLFKKIKKGVNLEVIIDACYSGTVTRGIKPIDELADSYSKARTIQAPFDYEFYDDFKVESNLPARRVFQIIAEPKTVNPSPNLNHTLWSGCMDKQLSYEEVIKGRVRGVFTYNFCSILRATNGNIKRSRLDSLITAAVKRYQNPQTPQLECRKEEYHQPIFF